MLPELSDFAEIITDFKVLKHETKRNLTKIKLKLELIDESILYVSEVRILNTNWFEYAYQWQKSDNSPIIRWDNAPYHPNIPNFPYHQHIGSETNIHPSPEMMSFRRVLAIIQLKMDNNEDTKKAKSWLKYSQLGVQMLVTIAAGTYIGHWLDQKFPHKLPIFTLCLSLFSIGAALYNVIKQLPKE